MVFVMDDEEETKAAVQMRKLEKEEHSRTETVAQAEQRQCLRQEDKADRALLQDGYVRVRLAALPHGGRLDGGGALQDVLEQESQVQGQLQEEVDEQEGQAQEKVVGQESQVIGQLQEKLMNRMAKYKDMVNNDECNGESEAQLMHGETGDRKELAR